MAFVYSASLPIASLLTYGENQWLFLLRHVQVLIIGSVLAWVFWKIPFTTIEKYYGPVFLLALLLLLLVLIPGVGKVVNGARRWIHLGFLRFQPSELIKILWVFYTAFYLGKRENDLGFKSLIPYFTVSAFGMLLIALEPDLSTAVLLLLLSGLILLLAGVPWTLFFGGALVSFLSVIFWLEQRSHLVSRFLFLNPMEDPYGRGYHILQSFLAFSRGGWTGVGPGAGIQKIYRLPEPHTDFIFSIISEEMGFLGSCLVLALFLVLFFRVFHLSQKLYRLSERLVMQGIVTLWILEAGFHIFVTLGLMPTTGIPLPFISYGRSSLLVHLIACGILLRLSARARSVPQNRTLHSQ